MPAPVSTVNLFLSVRLASFTHFAKQRIPLPHISASLPSLLMICIRKSAILDGKINITPSAPTPK